MSDLKSAQSETTQANSIPKTRFILISVISLIGLGLSLYLTQHFYQIRGGASHFRSECNLSSSMNCDVVAASPYAELFAGFPVSGLSGAWFVDRNNPCRGSILSADVLRAKNI